MLREDDAGSRWQPHRLQRSSGEICVALSAQSFAGLKVAPAMIPGESTVNRGTNPSALVFFLKTYLRTMDFRKIERRDGTPTRLVL